MSQNKISKLLNINYLYFAYTFFMILLIVDSKSILDIVYFLVVTFHYVRIKIHQRSVR